MRAFTPQRMASRPKAGRCSKISSGVAASAGFALLGEVGLAAIELVDWSATPAIGMIAVLGRKESAPADRVHYTSIGLMERCGAETRRELPPDVGERSPR